jgi:hypothetical protein
MAFETQELSRALGTPATLYYFACGEDPDAYFAYTDAEQAITYAAVAYQPIPIMRGSIATQGSLDKAVLDIQLPTESGLAELFKLYAPTRVVTVIVRQGHVDNVDNDWPAIWVGRIINIKRTGGQAVVSCEPVSTSMRRPGLRRHYQYGCMHALYGTMCKANKTAATVASTVSSYTGNTITLPAGWNGARLAAKFAGGLVQWTTPEGNVEIRTIIRVVGNALTVNGLLIGLAVATAVSVSLGCNHAMDDCQNLHVETGTALSNIVNYGGQPWIPTVNPIGYNNQYY